MKVFYVDDQELITQTWNLTYHLHMNLLMMKKIWNCMFWRSVSIHRGQIRLLSFQITRQSLSIHLRRIKAASSHCVECRAIIDYYWYMILWIELPKMLTSRRVCGEYFCVEKSLSSAFDNLVFWLLGWFVLHRWNDVCTL